MVDSLAITFHPSISGLIQGGEIKSIDASEVDEFDRASSAKN